MEFEAVILVTRGDEMPKKNYEKKLHPTYETSIRIKNSETSPHVVIKFFDQYRTLSNDLAKEGVGENLKIHIDAKFPPNQKSSVLGIAMSEEALQQRCYLLNKWMGNVFASFHLFPPAAQKILSNFLSLENDDAKLETNKELILELIQRKKSSDKPAQSLVGKVASQTLPQSTAGSTNSDTVNNEQSPTPSPQVTSTAQSNSSSKPEVRRRGSVNASDTLTEADVVLLSRETTFNSFLAVRVVNGDQVLKDDGKMHRAYEATLRMLPLEEVVMSGKEAVDYEAYRAHYNAVKPIKAAKAFDSYRNLKQTLETSGVQFRDSPKDSSSTEKAFVLDVAFPKSYSRSAMGFGLTDAQFQQRVAMLNNWMGSLMLAYNSLPTAAQNAINTFFSLATNIPNEAAYDVVIKMLNNTFEPAKKSAAEQVAGPPTMFGGIFQGKQQQQSQQQPQQSTTLPEESREAADNMDLTRRMSTGTVALTGAELDNLGKVTVVRGFLSVSVSMGHMINKKDGDKGHHGYETTVRILDSHELVGVTDLDSEAYAKHSSMPVKSTMTVFDGYRTLKARLQEAHVYSRDTASEARKDPKAVLVDALFPKTYPKSKLGIGLNEAELKLRVSVLNCWMGCLLSLFADMCEEAQERIVSFLSLEEDNPAEPQNRVIQAMLRGSYSPPKKVPLVAAAANGKGAKSGGKSSATSAAKGTAQSSNSNALTTGDEQLESHDNSAQPPGHNKGCGCTIM